MSRRRARRLLLGLRAVAVLIVVLFAGLSVPSTASACDAGMGYKPSISLFKNGLIGGDHCGAGASISGIVLLAVILVIVLAGVASRVLKRAALQAERLNEQDSPGAPAADRVLEQYLDEVGLGARNAGGQTGQ